MTEDTSRLSEMRIPKLMNEKETFETIGIAVLTASLNNFVYGSSRMHSGPIEA